MSLSLYMSHFVLRPHKIDSMFYLRIFVESYARKQKNNTRLKKCNLTLAVSPLCNSIWEHAAVHLKTIVFWRFYLIRLDTDNLPQNYAFPFSGDLSWQIHSEQICKIHNMHYKSYCCWKYSFFSIPTPTATGVKHSHKWKVNCRRFLWLSPHWESSTTQGSHF